MKIKFCGAAKEVTGSKMLFSFQYGNLLLDCGLFQGKREEAYHKNKVYPFEIDKVSSAIISHAHIDHVGALPIIVKNGFRGPVFLSEITDELSRIMLKDSARLQVYDSEFFNKTHKDSSLKIKPLYGEDDVWKTCSLFSPKKNGEVFSPFKNLNCRFLNSGHVLGSSMTILEAEGKRILYTSDLGRKNQLLLKTPQMPKDIDYLIIESTYGNREHRPIEDASLALEKLINEAIENKSKVIIPSFSLERTQELIFLIDFLTNSNRIGKIPIYVDSPMSIEITKIFNSHLNQYEFNDFFSDYVKKDKDPFGYDYINYVSEKRDSQKLNEKKGPMIIISASGMCEGGRILHHLRNNIEDENAILLIVGYQAKNTLGRKLKDNEKKVKIFGLAHEVFMRVVALDFFSAHADKNDLIEYIKEVSPKKGVFLVHGEDDQREGLSQELVSKGYKVFLPDYAQEFEV